MEFMATEVGSHSVLQGIFPTQGLNPGLPNFRQILYQLSHQASTKTILRQKVFQKSRPRMPTVPLWDRFSLSFLVPLLPCLRVWSTLHQQRAYTFWLSDGFSQW